MGESLELKQNSPNSFGLYWKPGLSVLTDSHFISWQNFLVPCTAPNTCSEAGEMSCLCVCGKILLLWFHSQPARLLTFSWAVPGHQALLPSGWNQTHWTLVIISAQSFCSTGKSRAVTAANFLPSRNCVVLGSEFGPQGPLEKRDATAPSVRRAECFVKSCVS